MGVNVRIPVEPPEMDVVDWRIYLPQGARERVVNKIMDTLKKLLPHSGPSGLEFLKQTAVTIEEKVYVVATSQTDYLRKISLKMLFMETKPEILSVDFRQWTCNGTGSNSQEPARSFSLKRERQIPQNSDPEEEAKRQKTHTDSGTSQDNLSEPLRDLKSDGFHDEDAKGKVASTSNLEEGSIQEDLVILAQDFLHRLSPSGNLIHHPAAKEFNSLLVQVGKIILWASEDRNWSKLKDWANAAEKRVFELEKAMEERKQLTSREIARLVLENEQLLAQVNNHAAEKQEAQIGGDNVKKEQEDNLQD